MDFKYNPGFSSDVDLIRSFVVRKPYLDLILENLRENNGSANQHVLVVGARGTGKTMLVRRVAAEVKTNPTLDAQWYPLVFAEESYQITSVGEFWLEALFHVAEQTQDASWQTVYEELRTEADEKRLRQRALAQLMDFADAQSKRILLVVENLNMLFAEQLGGHDDWELRHTLQNEPRLMLLGTATQRFEQIEEIRKAWFEFFTIYQLEALSLEDCRVLWMGVTGKPVQDRRLKPIRILTGGNPRLLRILIDFAGDLSLKDLMENLSQLIDEHTDYFKSHLDALAAAERKVFIALLELWDPKGAREVATVSRMNVSQTSALLNRLVSRGAVAIVEAKGRKKLYQASERLYNIYYLMRRRSHPSSRVKAAVTFMVSFYQGSELVDATSRLVNEACLLDPNQRTEHFWAYQAILETTSQPELREKLLKTTPTAFLGASDAPEFIRKLLKSSLTKLYEEGLELFAQAKELSESENYEESIMLLDRLIDHLENCTELPLLELLAKALFNKGAILGSLDRCEEAIAVYDKVILRFENHTELPLLKEIGFAFNNKGVSLGILEHYEKAIIVFDELIARFEARTELPLLEHLAAALYNKGHALSNLGRSEEEIAVYDELIARFDNCTELPLLEQLAKALFNKGVTLNHLGRSEEAIAVYDELIARFETRTELPLLEQIAQALFSKVQVLLFDLRRSSEEVIAVYDELITRFGTRTETSLLVNYSGALVNKGLALSYSDRLEEAIAVYDELIGRFEMCAELPLLEGVASALILKVFPLDTLGRFEEAEQSVRKCLAIFPTKWWVYGILAKRLVEHQKWSDLWALIPSLLIAHTSDPEPDTSILKVLIEIAAKGYAAEVLKAVKESEVVFQLEPFMIGLQIFLGEEPLVAQEVLEVGQDVAQSIRERQQALQSTDATA
jgi:tetratricopeptide (TPR) repeat protein